MDEIYSIYLDGETRQALVMDPEEPIYSDNCGQRQLTDQ